MRPKPAHPPTQPPILLPPSHSPSHRPSHPFCCSHGRSLTVLASCSSGYCTLDCSVEAPGGAANPCSGQGSLIHNGSLTTCDCACDGGYWDNSCSSQCAGGVTFDEVGELALCLGRGTCHDGRLGDGTCSCLDGYRGTFCQEVPLRVIVNMNVNLPADRRLLMDGLASELGVPEDNLELLTLVPASHDLSDTAQVAVFEIYSSGDIRATDVWTLFEAKHEARGLDGATIGYTITAISNRTFVTGEQQTCPAPTCNSGGDCDRSTGVCYCFVAFTGLQCAIPLDVPTEEPVDLTMVWAGIAAAVGGFVLAVGALCFYVYWRRRKAIKKYEQEKRERSRRESQRSVDSSGSDDQFLTDPKNKRFRRLSAIFGGAYSSPKKKGKRKSAVAPSPGGRRTSVRGRNSSGGRSSNSSGDERTDAWVEDLVRSRVESQLRKAGIAPDGGKAPDKHKFVIGSDGQHTIVPITDDAGGVHDPSYRKNQRAKLQAARERITAVAEGKAAPATNKDIFLSLRGAGKNGKKARSEKARGSKRVTRRPAPAMMMDKPRAKESIGSSVQVFSLTGEKVEMDGNWEGYANDLEAPHPRPEDAEPALPRAVALRDFVAQGEGEQTLPFLALLLPVNQRLTPLLAVLPYACPKTLPFSSKTPPLLAVLPQVKTSPSRCGRGTCCCWPAASPTSSGGRAPSKRTTS